jgi:hypothetical protein
MLRPVLLAITFSGCIVGPVCAQEQPPYSPPLTDQKMSLYTNADLAFSVRYPSEFIVRNAQDLQTVMDRGHRAAYGSDPAKDPDHQEAARCMHTLLYATSGVEASETSPDSPDTIMVVDFDRVCSPKGLKGDQALTQLAGTVLHIPGMTPVVPQTWFEAGGKRRIHSGMAAESITLPANASTPARQATLAVIAAAFAQKDHWILVVYLNGTREGGMHDSFGYTAVSFEDPRPILLFPFLLGQMKVVK